MERDDQAREHPGYPNVGEGIEVPPDGTEAESTQLDYTPEEIARIERRDATVRRVAGVLGVEPTAGEDFGVALVTAAGEKYDWLQILDAHLRLIDGWLAAEAARVGPDDVLVIKGDFGTIQFAEDLAEALSAIGLSERSLVLNTGDHDFEMKVVARDEAS